MTQDESKDPPPPDEGLEADRRGVDRLIEYLTDGAALRWPLLALVALAVTFAYLGVVLLRADLPDPLVPRDQAVAVCVEVAVWSEQFVGPWTAIGWVSGAGAIASLTIGSLHGVNSVKRTWFGRFPGPAVTLMGTLLGLGAFYSLSLADASAKLTAEALRGMKGQFESEGARYDHCVERWAEYYEDVSAANALPRSAINKTMPPDHQSKDDSRPSGARTDQKTTKREERKVEQEGEKQQKAEAEMSEARELEQALTRVTTQLNTVLSQANLGKTEDAELRAAAQESEGLRKKAARAARKANARAKQAEANLQRAEVSLIEEQLRSAEAELTALAAKDRLEEETPTLHQRIEEKTTQVNTLEKTLTASTKQLETVKTEANTARNEADDDPVPPAADEAVEKQDPGK